MNRALVPQNNDVVARIAEEMASDVKELLAVDLLFLQPGIEVQMHAPGLAERPEIIGMRSGRDLLPD